jgi:hypothetical protein
MLGGEGDGCVTEMTRTQCRIQYTTFSVIPLFIKIWFRAFVFSSNGSFEIVTSFCLQVNCARIAASTVLHYEVIGKCKSIERLSPFPVI